MNLWITIASIILGFIFGVSTMKIVQSYIVTCSLCKKPLKKHAPDCPILETDRLRSALAFYANPSHYDSDAWAPDDITDDGGRRARIALTRFNGHDGNEKPFRDSMR
jgi:hypothetical protein